VSRLSVLWALAVTVAAGVSYPATAMWRADSSLTSTLWAREHYLPAISDTAADDDPNTTDSQFLQYGRLGLSVFPEERDRTRVQFYASGRWRQALTGDLDAVGGDDVRVFETYADVSNVKHGVRLRAGRQFLPNAAGFWQLDGAHLTIRTGSVTGSAYGGVGGESWRLNEADAMLVGGLIEAQAASIGRLRAGALYRRDTSDTGDLNTLYLTGGFDAASGGFARIHPGIQRRSISADFAYDPSLGRLVRATALADADISLATIVAHVRYDTPQFAPDSIFRVFAQEAEREGSLTARVHVTDSLDGSIRHTEQRFDDGSARRDAVEASVRIDGESIAQVGMEWLRWEETRRRYMFFRVQKEIVPHVSVGFGSAVNLYRFADEETDAAARSAHAEVRARVSDNLRSYVRIERGRNRDYRRVTRALASIQLVFSAMGGVPR